MLALLNPFRSARARSAPRVRPSFRPRLETLEDRTCPSGSGTGSLLLTPLYTPSLSPLTPLSPLSSAQPVITLAVQVNGGSTVTLSGVVTTSGDPSGLTVTFTGVVNAATITLADGSFNLTVNANGLGEVDAQTVDQNGNLSNIASAQVACAAPTITNLSWTANAGNYTLSGQVVGPGAAGMQVTIWGQCNSLAAPVTVTCDSDGNFTMSFYVNVGETGFAFAQCTDCWGQQSNAAETQVFRT
jgi:hypothetical protein